MTSLPGSPGQAPASTDDARDEYLRSVALKNTAQAAGIRTRNIVIAILGGALVLAFALIIYLGLSFKNSGERSARASEATLSIAQQVTRPSTNPNSPQAQAQRAQTQAFVQTFINALRSQGLVIPAPSSTTTTTGPPGSGGR